jgi:glycosyltransferase involved in cell wall biosynthesis
MALASLAEGAAYSTLEALACATPVVATAVGGMAVQLRGYARLTRRQDPQAMCEQFLWIADHPEQARAQALLGREYVVQKWSSEKAFEDLLAVLEGVSRKHNRTIYGNVGWDLFNNCPRSCITTPMTPPG